MTRWVKNLPAILETGVQSWARMITWRRKGQSSSVSLPGEPHEERVLAHYGSYSSSKESDMTEATEHSCTYRNTEFKDHWGREKRHGKL